jgi:hypothetical protein
VRSSGERPKGIAQLARSVGALARREWTGPHDEYARVTSVYPVLTVYDGRMAAPGVGRFLDDEFRSLMGSVPDGISVHPLIIVTIEDLEHLISGVESLIFKSQPAGSTTNGSVGLVDDAPLQTLLDAVAD